MKPFEPAVLTPESIERTVAIVLEHRKDLTYKQARRQALRMSRHKLYKNDEYQVAVYPIAVRDNWPAMIHLSIKRLDRSAIRDWRALQEIKNLIVGPDHEAVELYPADARLVDSANQFHLWVLADPTLRFPFGFNERLVSESCTHNVVQRPFGDSDGSCSTSTGDRSDAGK